jgi:hypothetical protein
MAYKSFHGDRNVMKYASSKALEAINGLGVMMLTNTDNNSFWYTDDSFKTRYKHEEANVGDRFYDGNNGDQHEVLAVDLSASRLAMRNLDQNDHLIDLVCW